MHSHSVPLTHVLTHSLTHSCSSLKIHGHPAHTSNAVANWDSKVPTPFRSSLEQKQGKEGRGGAWQDLLSLCYRLGLQGLVGGSKGVCRGEGL